MNVQFVTGYVPISDHPRSAHEYGKLGDKLCNVKVPIKAFYNTLDQCWLKKFLWEHGDVWHATADNPQKNTLAFHIVQHQKTEWLWAASALYPDADVFAWIDYGIFHVPGVTAAVIEQAAERIRSRNIVIPGCWEQRPVPDDIPCWRFCGGFFTVPRKLLRKWDQAVKEQVMRNVFKRKKLTFEVNNMARAELHDPSLPILWYKADHNETMFTNYPGLIIE